MSIDLDKSIGAREYLLLVAGEVCPCGHNAGEHDEPTSDLPGDFLEVMGRCLVEGCDCKGLIE
jgi:hypothetical protein